MLQSMELPGTVNEAAAILATPGETNMVLGGGTLVMRRINEGAHGIDRLVSLSRLDLDRVTVADGEVRAGAMATLAALAAPQGLEFLASAIASIGSPALRTTATIGGNLFSPAPYGDLATCLLALDAVVTVATGTGAKARPVDDVIRAGVAAGEIVTGITFRLPRPDAWYFRKAMRRAMSSASIVTVAAHLPLSDGRVRGARLALGGIGARPARAVAAEKLLEGQALSPERVQAAALLARDDVLAVTDAYASAWYRDRVLPVHIRRALSGA